MADPFQPKFVDLVRNFSTTTGTGNFVLGPAANGYTSFTAACQAGDSFYYSAINVDKPAEREVGRGTLLAGGVISRDAIIGSETNFSSGNKSIALIAAADWFSTVHSTVSALGALPSVASTRTALAAVTQRQAPALLCEAGREGLFTWDGSNLSAKVSADSARGIYVAPATDPSGATGAWVRRFDGAVNVRWFGAIGDDAANDGAAFSAALAVLQALAPANGPYGYQGRGAQSLFIPAGRYFLGTTTLDITSTLIIEGQGVGSEAAQSTVLRWAGDTTGIRVQSTNTSGATTSGLSLTTSGAGTIIRNLELYGAYSGANQADYHGIHLRARATVQDVFIDKFQGDGIHILANATANNGNANQWRLERAVIQNCRNGLFVDGPDVNAGHGLAVSAISNRQWGIHDSSFLGNSYVACHTSSNALGPYKTDDVAANNLFVGCYSESDQSPSSFVAPTLVLGGVHGAGISGVGMLAGMNEGLHVAGQLRIDSNASLFGNSNNFGPQTGTPTDSNFYVDNTNSGSWIVGRYWNAGSPTTLGSLRFINGFGTYLNAAVGSVVLQNAGADIATVSASGLNLASGKDLQFNGTTVPLRNVTASRLIGRTSASAGVAQEITPAGLLGLSGQTLTGRGYRSATVYQTESATLGSTTLTVNNSGAFVSFQAAKVWHDFDLFPATHYRLVVRGQANEAAQTIKCRMHVNNDTTALHAGTEDVTVTNTLGDFDSGWLPITALPTGFVALHMGMKGSNATVDLSLVKAELHLRIV